MGLDGLGGLVFLEFLLGEHHSRKTLDGDSSVVKTHLLRVPAGSTKDIPTLTAGGAIGAPLTRGPLDTGIFVVATVAEDLGRTNGPRTTWAGGHLTCLGVLIKSVVTAVTPVASNL